MATRISRIPAARAATRDYPGRLVAVEGLDGSGKSTQVYLLKRWLELEGHKVCFTEWNSSDLVREATRKGKKRNMLTPTTFSLVHCTDFADRYERHVLPMLEAGFIVLADRYKYTALARDTVRGCDPGWVERLYSFAVEPHVTFYFRLPLATALSRILSGRPNLKYHEAGMDLHLSENIEESFSIFQGRILDQYEAMKERHAFTVLDSERSVEAVQQDLRRIVSERIDLARFRVSRWARTAP